MRQTALRIFILTLALPPLGAERAAAAPRWAVEAAFAAGHDSNPLRVQEDGPGAAYAETRVALAAQGDAGRRFAWTANVRGTRRDHEATAAYADTTFVGAESAAAFGILPSSPTRWVVRAGLRGASHRLTYVDRTTGGPVLTLTDPLDPDSIVSLADRLDHDVAAAFVESRWRLSRRMRASVNVSRERMDFRDDYEGYSTIGRLDQRAWLVEPRLSWEPLDGFRIDGSYLVESREYDDLSAVDETGGSIDDTRRRYRQGAGRIAVVVRTSESWDLDAGVDRSSRRDRFAGYYDSRGWNAWASGSGSLGARFRGRLTWSRGALDYPNARVSSEPESGFRENAVTRLVGRVDRPLPRGFGVSLETGRQRAVNADAEFTYGRTWVQAGVRWQHEGGRR